MIAIPTAFVFLIKHTVPNFCKVQLRLFNVNTSLLKLKQRLLFSQNNFYLQNYIETILP